MAIGQRRLGGAGPQVGALGLGCMGMSQSYGVRDDAESVATLHRAIDLGMTLLDTADVYGAGANERLLAQVLADRRDEVVLATKVGLVPAAGQSIPGGVDGTPEHIHAGIRESLRRLGTDHVDLYYLHRVDPDVPVEESVGAMAELVEQGLVRHLGLSEPSADQLRRAVGVHPVAAVQSEWSLFTRDVETDVLPAARELGVALVPFSPLGRGLLTGAVTSTQDMAADDMRRGFPRFAPENLEANLALVEQVRRSRPSTARRRGRWRWPGCSPRGRTWCRSPGPSVGGTSRRTWLRPTCG